MEGKLSGAEQAELGRLQGAVAQIESALRFSAGMDAATIGALSAFLVHLQDRMAGLEVKGQERAEEERTKADQEGRISAMVDRERALNEAEKQEYAALLHEEYFTKANFSQLEHFYSHAWGKLTDEGKDEMSHRVWEGVRRHEYRFSELPEAPKEKEAQRVEISLKRGGNAELAAIPEQDRSDFLEARANGQRQQSYTILDRPAFAQHVALSKERGGTEKPPEVAKANSGEPAKKPYSTNTVDAAQREDSIKLTLEDANLVDSGEASQRPPLTGYNGSPAAKRQAASLDR